MRARSAVQLETGKRVDRLSADVQPEVAASMGFDDEPGLPAIDGLMRTVFEHARTVDAVVRTALARTIAGPSAGSTAPLAGPADVLEALAAADGTIAPALVDAVAAAAIPSPVAWDARTRDAFLGLLRRGEGGVAALDVLDRVGALERFVPGWRDVRSRPQRDPYHRFTVDGHLLRTLAGVDALLEDPSGDPIAAELAAELPDPEAVALGALLHDIGKVGRGEHVPVGAEVARGPGRRDGSRAARGRARLVHGRRAPAPARHRDTPGPHRREPDPGRGGHDRHRGAAGRPVPAGGRRRRRHRSRGVDAVAAGADPRARDEGPPCARARHDGCASSRRA